MRRLPLLFILLIISGCSSSKKDFDIEKEKFLVEKAINGSIGWAKDKNLAYLYNIIANDSSFLEVHPGNRIIKGFREFRKAEEFWMSSDFKAIRYEIRDLKITISQSGDAAWWFCILDDIN
jgi:hypothetical protein